MRYLELSTEDVLSSGEVQKLRKTPVPRLELTSGSNFDSIDSLHYSATTSPRPTSTDKQDEVRNNK